MSIRTPSKKNPLSTILIPFMWAAAGAAGMYIFLKKKEQLRLSKIKSGESISINIGKLLDFLLLAGQLKRCKRTGWVNHKVPDVESVSDHSWRMAVMASVILPAVDQNLDIGKAVEIGLLHDIAESIVGDITPYDGVSDAEKHELEMKAILQLQNTLGIAEGEGVVMSRWKDYEFVRCGEAEYIKDFDKLEMIIQAYEYELMKKERMNGPQTKEEEQMDLCRFYKSCEKKMRTSIGEALRVELMRRVNMM